MRIGTVQSLHRFPVKSMAGEVLERVDVHADGFLGDRAFALRDEAAGEIRGGKKWPALMMCAASYRSEPTTEALPAVDITLPDGTKTGTDDAKAAQHLSRFLSRAVTLHPRRPASDKQHYRRAQPGASLAGALARAAPLRKVVAQLAKLGPAGAELRSDFGRLAGEPLPDLAAFPAELFEFVSPLGTYFDAFPIHIVTTATLASLRTQHPHADWDERRFRANLILETLPEFSGCVELGWGGRVLRIGEVRLKCTVPTPRCGMIMQAHQGVAKDPRVLRAVVQQPHQAVGIYASVLQPGRITAADRVEFE